MPNWLNIPGLETCGPYPQQRWSEDTERNIEDNRRVCSCPQSTTSESLAQCMLQQREMKAKGKAAEPAREAYEGLPI